MGGGAGGTHGRRHPKGDRAGRDPPSNGERSGKRMLFLKRENAFPKEDVSARERMCLAERECTLPKENVSSRGRMCLPERECVFPIENVSFRRRACPLDRECGCVSETHSECLCVKSRPPNRLWICFQHQIELKRCEKFTGLITIYSGVIRVLLGGCSVMLDRLVYLLHATLDDFD